MLSARARISSDKPALKAAFPAIISGFFAFSRSVTALSISFRTRFSMRGGRRLAYFPIREGLLRMSVGISRYTGPGRPEIVDLRAPMVSVSISSAVFTHMVLFVIFLKMASWFTNSWRAPVCLPDIFGRNIGRNDEKGRTAAKCFMNRGDQITRSGTGRR